MTIATAAGGVGRLARAMRSTRPAARVVAFTGTLAIAVFVFNLAAAGVYDHAPSSVRLPWWAIALGFMFAELKVVDVHFRREKHSFSLSEFPAVIGLFTLSASDYLLAVVVGTGAALLWSRQPPLKFGFNVVNFAAAATVTLIVFHIGIDISGSDRVALWLAAFAATTAAAVFSAFTIASVISLSGGAPQYQKLPEMIQFGGLVAIANTSLALLAVSVLQQDLAMLVLLVVPLMTVFLAYRAYLSEREKHERLELLYQSSRILQHSPELDSTVVALLDHARNMFRAERADLVLFPRESADEALLTSVSQSGMTDVMKPVPRPDEPHHRRAATEAHPFFYVPSPAERALTDVRQAMIAALRGESRVIGTIVIANRITEGTAFLDEDLRLLETLANQAAVALENGQLEQSLAELSRLKEQLRYQAYHDPLTGLANRSLLGERVAEMLSSSVPGWHAVVLFLDLDNFKVVNDSLGHAAGDTLLVAVADRVRRCVREDDTAARLGGDEFAVLLRDEANLARAVSITKRVLEELQHPFQVAGHEISISGSIGIAAASPDIEGADELLRNADVAMYTAKEGGKNRFAVFDPSVHSEIVARHSMSSDLSKAVSRGELAVLYQPITRLATGAIVGFEALVRWRHPIRGLVNPTDFIGLAEENGSILTVGRWVLEQACRDMVWLDRTVRPKDPLFLTVNLSAAQLRQPEFVEDLAAILKETDFSVNRLILEMTETAMFSDTQTTIARLQALRALGVQIAVDDFGTGYSSLGYLRRFEVDALKIAREFVAEPDADSDEWAFAGAIVALGKTLGLRIVAEGIEYDAQLERLRAMGCELGQGFLIARPTSITKLEPMLRQHNQTPADPARVTVRRARGLAAAS